MREGVESTVHTMSGHVIDLPSTDTAATTATSSQLSPSEVADAAAVAALVFTSAAIGRLLAFGTFFQLLSTVVIAVLASRRRLRAVFAAGATAAMMAILLGGIGPISQITTATLFGAATGTTISKGRGQLRAMARSILWAWPPISILTLAFLAVFKNVRELNFENVRNGSVGAANFVGGIDNGLGWLSDRATDSIGTGLYLSRIGDPLAWASDNLVDGIDKAIVWWVVATPVAQLIITIGYSVFAYRVSKPVIGRVNATLGPPLNHEVGPTGPPGQANLRREKVIRAGSTVATVDISLSPGELVALTGPNGAGKSSTIGALAGFDGVRFATNSWNATGLGRMGGTGVIGQNPAAQILAPRVRDELAWGGDVDDARIQELLEQVGIAHLADRDSAALSGGELQRLAIAAALALEPTLLLSDESTSMLDPAGREAVVGVLRAAADAGAAVLHASHVLDDLAVADEEVSIGVARPRVEVDSTVGEPGPLVMSTRKLVVVHDNKSPWAVEALADIDLDLREGQLTLLTGSNGSGKTTLAWSLAGLIAPASGEISFRGEPLTEPTNAIGLAFQHARLQLLRNKVRSEVKAISGLDEVDPLLEAMGLDATKLGNRRIDQLSGGEQRRVLLAGLLGRDLDVVILDEPLAGLDAEGRDRLMAAVQHFLAARVAVVVVSHEPEWASDLVHQRIALDGGRVVDRRVRS